MHPDLFIEIENQLRSTIKELLILVIYYVQEFIIFDHYLPQIPFTLFMLHNELGITFSRNGFQFLNMRHELFRINPQIKHRTGPQSGSFRVTLLRLWRRILLSSARKHTVSKIGHTQESSTSISSERGKFAFSITDLFKMSMFEALEWIERVEFPCHVIDMKFIHSHLKAGEIAFLRIYGLDAHAWKELKEKIRRKEQTGHGSAHHRSDPLLRNSQISRQRALR